MATMNGALAKHYDETVPAMQEREATDELLGHLRRLYEAKQSALQEMKHAADDGARAREMQMCAELLLAHGNHLGDGGGTIDTTDYSGTPVQLTIEPGITNVVAAERLFAKAKRAKASAKAVLPRIESTAQLLHELDEAITMLQSGAKTVAETHSLASEQGWLRERRQGPPLPKAERPYQGHRIRETHTPGGRTVLYGENATSNDYLSTKVARPNDYWFHVRGAQGSHVVLRTDNQPQRIQPDEIAFAAKVAARNSGQKHASHVPVSYTLAKYVRKPRKAAPGSVTIANEKTLFVDP